MRYLLTQDGITVTILGKPYAISSRHRGFDKVRDAVLSKQDPVKVLGIIQSEANAVQNAVREQLERQNLTGSLFYEDGVVFFNGQPLHNYAVDTLVKFLGMGHDVTALASFIDRQQANPSEVVHEHLYAFLEHGKIPLTPDGHFLAYKAVRADYKDIHSGSFLNSVGEKPRLAGGRDAVDPDRNNTCSRGLHVCSFGYLPNFSHDDGHVMVCKVDPYDVVAIPSDYNNTKMRVVGYEVVGEVTSYYRRGEDVLATERLADVDRYKVEYEVWGGEADVRQLYDTFYTSEEAIEEAIHMVQEGDAIEADETASQEAKEAAVMQAWVIDTKTGKVIHEAA